MATYTCRQYFCTTNDTILYVSSSVSSVSNKAQEIDLSKILVPKREISQIFSGNLLQGFNLLCTHRNIPLGCSDGYTTKMKLETLKYVGKLQNHRL